MPDLNDQLASKEALDLEKLSLEVQSLRAKAGLEKAKLELDIKNLSRAFRNNLITAVLSASVAMTIAVVGWTVQARREQKAAMLTEGYRREELYNKMIENLGSANPSLRLAAVVGLSEYAQPGGQISGRQTSAEVVNALTNRLATEEDVAIQEQIFLTIGSLGKAPLPQIADANRRAAAQFVGDSGELTGLILLKKSNSKSDGGYLALTKVISEDLPLQLRPVSLVFELAVSRGQSQKGSANSAPTSANEENAGSSDSQSAKRFSSSGLLHLMGLYRGDRLRDQTFRSHIELVKSTKPDKLDSAITLAEASFRRSARFLVATNIALEQVLRASSGQLRGESLDGMVIIWANLNKLNLEGLSLRNSFIRADASDAKLNYCDFSNSILVDLRVARAEFRGATLNNSILPAELDWLDDDFPDMSGANWWDNSLEIENDEPKPADLEALFPKAVQEVKRKTFLEEWKRQK